MSDNPANTSKLQYMHQPEKRRWIISHSNDTGIALNMQDLGAQIITQNNTLKRYWILQEDKFPKIQPLLDALGYTDHNKEPQTANYRAPTVSSVPQESSPNPQVSLIPPIIETLEKTYSIRQCFNNN